ncbi:MAG: hydrolase, partial [Rubrivivax sp.]|nr:hydrolase [Rubrivivax sp.]
MRIATYQFQGRRHVGQVSADGLSVTAFSLADAAAQRGALSLVEDAAAGVPWPALAGAAVALSHVRL